MEVHALEFGGDQGLAVSAHVCVHLAAVQLDVHRLLLLVHVTSRQFLEANRVHDSTHLVQCSRGDVALEEHDLVAIVALPLFKDLLIHGPEDVLVEVVLQTEVPVGVVVVGSSFGVIKRIVADHEGVLRESLCQFVPEVEELVLQFLVGVVKLVVQVDCFGRVCKVEFRESEAGFVCWLFCYLLFQLQLRLRNAKSKEVLQVRFIGSAVMFKFLVVNVEFRNSRTTELF